MSVNGDDGEDSAPGATTARRARAANTARASGPVEIWRGGVNAWDCDEMGHMNVRHYVARAQEGLGGLALRLGAPQAFAPHATATLKVRQRHIRFVREARPGDALIMTGGVVEMDETTAVLVQLLTHGESGEPCASFLTQVTHATPVEGRVFPWTDRARAAAAELATDIPHWAKPRGVTGRAPAAERDPRGPAASLTCISRGVVQAQDCDVFGGLSEHHVIGRISEGMGGLMSRLRGAVAKSTGVRRAGGAALEYRLSYDDPPRAGDHIRIDSAFMSIEPKVQRIGHWVTDPVSGRPWATVQAVVTIFDLDARKIIALPANICAEFQDQVTPGLIA